MAFHHNIWNDYVVKCSFLVLADEESSEARSVYGFWIERQDDQSLGCDLWNVSLHSGRWLQLSSLLFFLIIRRTHETTFSSSLNDIDERVCLFGWADRPRQLGQVNLVPSEWKVHLEWRRWPDPESLGHCQQTKLQNSGCSSTLCLHIRSVRIAFGECHGLLSS